MDQKVVLAQMDPTDGFLFNFIDHELLCQMSIKMYFLLRKMWRLHLIRMLDWCLVVEVTIKDGENKFITA